VIVVPEARGLILAGMISGLERKKNNLLKPKPIVVLTKSDKLGLTNKKECSRGYTNEKTIIHLYKSFEKDLRNKRVLFIDDGLSSGNTTITCLELIEQFNAVIVSIFVIVQHHYCNLVEEYEKKYLPITHKCYDIYN
jgi:adenine/guanine phosphoribosyltransferase-like PRPP-binding protein